MEVTFGEYIKQRRGELGFPLRKVASHIDIDPSTLGKIEKDERCLNLEHLDRLSTILSWIKSPISLISVKFVEKTALPLCT